MKSLMIILATLMVIMGGCRFVLDDNPPEEDSEKAIEDETESSETNDTAANSETIFLSSLDPHLYSGITPQGIPLLVIGERKVDGSIQTIEQVRFGAKGAQRVLNIYSGLWSYEPSETLRIDVRPNNDGATAQVTNADLSAIQSFWLSTDGTIAEVDVNREHKSAASAQSTMMGAYAQSTGHFVAGPIACGKEIRAADGTQVHLTLSQEGFERHYPVRLDDNSVWRTSAPMPNYSGAVIADIQEFKTSLNREVGRACNGMLSAEPGKEDMSSLESVAKNLAGMSPSNSIMMMQYKQDMAAFCQLLSSELNDVSEVNDFNLRMDAPIDASLVMKQGLHRATALKNWTTEATDIVTQEVIEASDEPLVLGIDYNRAPLYVGDEFPVQVYSQCSDNGFVSITARDDAGQEFEDAQRHLYPTTDYPIKSEVESLFQVKEEGRYSVTVKLNHEDNPVDVWDVRPTLR